MKKYLLYFLTVLALTPLLYLSRQKLGSLLLTRQLSSQNEVERIIAGGNQLYDFNSPLIFNNKTLPIQNSKSDLLSKMDDADQVSADKPVLGAESDRWIEVVLSQQRLYAWEGGNRIYSFLISSGKWAPTPTGEYNIWIKLAKTTMKGGSKALGTYYYLPNVPCTMYFYKGYGIHGAYWHNNFGQPMSHGCVNMKPDDACTLFAWASVGTQVKIHN